jgi:hypothetical protein
MELFHDKLGFVFAFALIEFGFSSICLVSEKTKEKKRENLKLLKSVVNSVLENGFVRNVCEVLNNEPSYNAI